MKDLYDCIKRVQADLWESGSNLCIIVEFWKWDRGVEEMSFKVWDGNKHVLNTTSPEIFRRFSELKKIDQEINLIIDAK